MCARVEQISRPRVGLGGVSEKHAIRINAIEHERDVYQKNGRGLARGARNYNFGRSQMQGQQAENDRRGKGDQRPRNDRYRGSVRTNLLVTTITAREVYSTVDTVEKATTTEISRYRGWGTGIKETAKVKVDRTTTPGENNPWATVAPGTSAGASRATQS